MKGLIPANVARLALLSLAFSVSSLFLALPAAAQSAAKKKNHFPTSSEIERRAQFWEKIFTQYASDTVVVHDLDQQEMILGTCAADVDCELYDSVLDSFRAEGPGARKLSAAHQKIWSLYAKDADAKSRLLRGEVRLRKQPGLSDIFLRAAITADKLLPKMEKVFRSHGIPVELTRIVFVESMFNVNARSKVGASGIWQLMPAAARDHIKVNRRVDERNHPMRATLAAARILKKNKERLGNWPLAITAYNHGANGVARGVKKTGSQELTDLLLKHESPTWGFASNNFYAEFLAAKRVYKKLQDSRKTALSARR